MTVVAYCLCLAVAMASSAAGWLVPTLVAISMALSLYALGHLDTRR